MLRSVRMSVFWRLGSELCRPCEGADLTVGRRCACEAEFANSLVCCDVAVAGSIGSEVVGLEVV